MWVGRGVSPRRVAWVEAFRCASSRHLEAMEKQSPTVLKIQAGGWGFGVNGHVHSVNPYLLVRREAVITINFSVPLLRQGILKLRFLYGFLRKISHQFPPTPSPRPQAERRTVDGGGALPLDPPPMRLGAKGLELYLRYSCPLTPTRLR